MLLLYVQGGHGNDGDNKVDDIGRGKAGLLAEGERQLSCGCSSQPLLPADKSWGRSECWQKAPRLAHTMPWLWNMALCPACSWAATGWCLAVPSRVQGSAVLASCSIARTQPVCVEAATDPSDCLAGRHRSESRRRCGTPARSGRCVWTWQKGLFSQVAARKTCLCVPCSCCPAQPGTLRREQPQPHAPSG